MADKTLTEEIEEMDRRSSQQHDRRKSDRLAKEKLFLPTQRAKLVRDNVLKVKMDRGPITTPQKAAAIFGEFFRDATVEIAAIMALNMNNEYLGMSVVGTGTIDRVHVDPIEVIGRIWSYQAASFVMAHNHPSGNIEPSLDDLEMLKELRGFGIALNRPMRDFLIIGFDDDGCVKTYSHRDRNYDL